MTHVITCPSIQYADGTIDSEQRLSQGAKDFYRAVVRKQLGGELPGWPLLSSSTILGIHLAMTGARSIRVSDSVIDGILDGRA